MVRLLVVRVGFLFLLSIALLSADFDYRVENTNFTISQGSLNPLSDEEYLYNSNRLRFRGDYIDENFFFLSLEIV